MENKEKTVQPHKPAEMSFFEHLGELRKRLLITILSVAAGAFLTYYFSEQIFKILSEPYFAYFPENSLIGTGPAEAFILKIKVALFCSFLLTLPVTFLQLWLFIAPGLYDNERKLAFPFIVIASFLFCAGVFACYKLILPFTLSFFMDQYTSIGVTPQIKISEHLSLMMFALAGFGAMFETPVLFYVLAKLRVLESKTLVAGWRYALITIFILAAVLTPTPDVLTMFLFAFPLILLYCVSVMVVKLTYK